MRTETVVEINPPQDVARITCQSGGVAYGIVFSRSTYDPKLTLLFPSFTSMARTITLLYDKVCLLEAKRIR